MLRDSAELKISVELVQPIAQRAHVYRRSIVRWRTLLDKKVEDDFKISTDRVTNIQSQIPIVNTPHRSTKNQSACQCAATALDGEISHLHARSRISPPSTLYLILFWSSSVLLGFYCPFSMFKRCHSFPNTRNHCVETLQSFLQTSAIIHGRDIKPCIIS